MQENHSPEIERYQQKFSELRSEIHRWIVGQEELIDRLLIAILANGHVLLEGVPGLAKTKTLTALSACLDVQMKRVQVYS